MIHATWRKDGSTGRWAVFIEKDKFWGKEEPQPFDKVLVQARSGEVKEVQIDCAHAELGGWFCPLVDQKSHSYEGFNDYDYEDDQLGNPFGSFWDDTPFAF